MLSLVFIVIICGNTHIDASRSHRFLSLCRNHMRSKCVCFKELKEWDTHTHTLALVHAQIPLVGRRLEQLK